MAPRRSSPARRAAGSCLALALTFVGCSSHRDVGSSVRADQTEPASTNDPALALRVASARHLGIVPASSAPHVVLPARADREVELSPRGSELSVRFAMRGASSVEPRVVDGASVYPGALGGADVMHAPLSDGVEDLVFFDRAPAREELVYDVDVTHVRGLRMVSGTLELLDAGGAPRIRVARPWLVDARGVRVDLDLRVEGCAFDRDPRAPWGRPVTPPGAGSCRMRLAWHDVPYPLVVDPAWKLGASASPRHGHASITFASGKILSVSGTVLKPGLGNGPTDTGELYDPATGTWAGGVSLPNPRVDFAMALLPSGKALLVGGGGSSRPELIDDAGGAGRTQMDTTFPASTGLSATALPNGRVLVAGGGSGPAATQAQLYDEAMDVFLPAGVAPAGSLKAARSHHTATRLTSGKVLFAGGAAVPSAEIYDPVANTFTLLAAPMVHLRRRHTASLLADGRVLIVGGGNATSEIYDPAQQKFTASGMASTDRASAQAVVLASGDVLVAGGEVGGPLSSVEIFDKATQVFTAQPALSFARTQFAAERLAQGEVIVFGGLGTTGFSLSGTEIWVPGAPGGVCTTGDDCRSGACEEGVCCSAACVGPCQTCVAGTGACAPVKGKDDPSSCTGPTTCDAAGACKKKNGQKCAAASECASAECVDGTCCDRACNGQCEACDVAGYAGTCAPVAGAPRNGRPLCSAPGTTCGGTCNGLDGNGCAYPSAVTTCAAACAGELLTASTCDGRGACVADAPRGCAGNFVCESATACKTSCTADADCASGYRCEAGRCLPIALCEERFVTKGTEKVDCFPYTCEQSGSCRVSCASVSDCVAPTLCSLDGHCVDPPVAPTAGCRSAPSPNEDLSSQLLVALMAVLGVRGARRRAGRSA